MLSSLGCAQPSAYSQVSFMKPAAEELEQRTYYNARFAFVWVMLFHTTFVWPYRWLRQRANAIWALELLDEEQSEGEAMPAYRSGEGCSCSTVHRRLALLIGLLQGGPAPDMQIRFTRCGYPQSPHLACSACKYFANLPFDMLDSGSSAQALHAGI